MIGNGKGKSNEIAGLYGSILLTLVTLLLFESSNVFGSLNCLFNLVAKTFFLTFVKLATSPFFTFQNLKKINYTIIFKELQD